jgi:hypothetical protein
MRKAVKLSFVLIFMAILGPSCELLEDCKSCTIVTEESNGDTTYGSTATYCGSELELKETESETINGKTTYYECE